MPETFQSVQISAYRIVFISLTFKHNILILVKGQQVIFSPKKPKQNRPITYSKMSSTPATLWSDALPVKIGYVDLTLKVKLVLILTHRII